MKNKMSCLVVGVFCCLFLDGTAWGAYLEEVSRNVIQIPEAQPQLLQDDPCHSYANATADSGVSEGTAAFVLAATEASVSGTEECTESVGIALALASAELELVVQPEGNDQIGDCVRIFYISSYSLSAAANGTAYEAEASVGGLDGFDSPVRIILDEGHRSCSVLQYGPKTLQSGSDSNAYEGEFIARVGDKILLAIAAQSETKGLGAGSANAFATGVSISIKVEDLGPCDAPSPCEPVVPKPVPTIGWYGSGILMILLSAAAVLFMRRRRLHR